MSFGPLLTSLDHFSTIKLVTTHRLDPEKGRDLILNWLKKKLSIEHGALSIEFDIYGQGKMQDEIESLAKQYPEHIRYHGFVSIHEIYAGKMDYDFVPMPSKFLETFGLSALDFLQFGIPVIGYKKGGLVPFISDNLNISNYPGEGQEQFNNAMDTIINNYIEDRKLYRVDKDQIINTYGTTKWLERFESIVHRS